jgi:hypothetical protein
MNQQFFETAETPVTGGIDLSSVSLREKITIRKLD